MRRARLLAYAGGVTGLGSLAFYVALLLSQDSGFPAGAFIFVAIILASSIAALAAPSVPEWDRQLLSWATLGFFIVGFLGLMTIGLLFLIAAGFTAIARAMLRGPRDSDV